MPFKIQNTKGFKTLMLYLDAEHLVEKAMDLDDSQIQQMIDWQILEEERLEAKILIWLDDQKQQMLKRFDDEFVPLYEDEQKTEKAINSLSEINLEPRLKYKQIGIFRLHKYTIPTQCKEWFQKDDIGTTVESVSYVNPDPFREAMDDSTFRAYYSGGQSSFTILNIPLSFNLLDKDAERRLKNYIFQLSTQVSAQIQSEIQLQLLEGIRNFESIPQLRNRILKVWDKPIQVNVPPKVKGGKVVRSGYSYQLSAEQWATTVARTEVARAFQLGRIDAYKQTGIVQKVKHAVTPDERLCNICAPMDGNIYTLEEAQSVFPVHANCRCTPIPIINYDGVKPVSEVMTENVTNNYIDAGLIIQ